MRPFRFQRARSRQGCFGCGLSFAMRNSVLAQHDRFPDNSRFPDRSDQLFAFPFTSEVRYLCNQSFQRGHPMYQPHKKPSQNSHSPNVRVGDVDRLANALRALDRTVVEISMQIYKVPRRDRALMLKLHRRLHDKIRQGLPGLMHRPQRSAQFVK